VNERLLLGHFKHSVGHLSVIAAYALTKGATNSEKEDFYAQLESVTLRCDRNDMVVILCDFNAVAGTMRTDDTTAKQVAMVWACVAKKKTLTG